MFQALNQERDRVAGGRRPVRAALFAALVTLAGCGGGERAATNGGPPVVDGSTNSITDTLVETYRRVGALFAEAYQGLASEVTDVWGNEHMEMPGQKTFVYYEEDMAARMVMDFEAGKLRVERVIEPGDDETDALNDMRTAVDAAAAETPRDMARHDMIFAKMATMAEGDEARLFPPPPAPPPPASSAAAPTPEPAPEIAPAPVARPAPTAPPARDEADTAELAEVLPADAADRLDQATITRTPIVGDDGRERVMLSYTVDFIPGFYGTLAMRYADTVMAEAARHKIPPSLILAIIEAESAFNPRAISPIPAFGLMQIVAQSAGIDVARYVTGERRIFTPAELYDPEQNIRFGTIYLKILKTRYLRAIADPESRLYCAIAAYNTGAGNVARAFTGRTSVGAAADVINAMTPAEVLAHLRRNLPFEETRRYVVKVLEARVDYLDWDDKVQFVDQATPVDDA